MTLTRYSRSATKTFVCISFSGWFWCNNCFLINTRTKERWGDPYHSNLWRLKVKRETIACEVGSK